MSPQEFAAAQWEAVCDPCPPGPDARRAEVLLRMYEGVARSVAARVAHGRELAAAAGVPLAAYQAMTVEEREAVLRRGRRVMRASGPETI